MSFEKKVVLITGGSSGIGAATAVLFAKEGANVVIVARNETKLMKVSNDIIQIGATPLVIKADLTNAEEARTVLKKTIDSYGKLDILVNNAGILRFASVDDENFIEIYDQVMNINIRTIVFLTSLAAPYLIKTKGNIVNISSTGGAMVSSDKDFNGIISYGTSKAALNHFSRLAAVELAKKGVRVNVISPGPVMTNIFENCGKHFEKSMLAEKTMLKMLPEIKEVAELVLYLASEKAKSITGSNYTVDAGITLR